MSAHPDEDLYARRWWILGVLCLSLVLIVAANSSLNVTLPTLVRDMGATTTQLQWIVDAYAIVFAGLLLPMGAIGDRFGRKGTLQAGLLIAGPARRGPQRRGPQRAAVRDHRRSRAGLDRRDDPRGLRDRDRRRCRVRVVGGPRRAPHAGAAVVPRPRFSVGAGTISLAFFAAFGVFFLATQYFQFVKDFSPLTAALAGLPIAVALMLVAPRSAGLVERFSHRNVVAAGLLTMAVGLAWLGIISTPTVSYWLIWPGLLLFGSGMALTMAPSTGLILAAMPVNRAGVGSAVNDTVREFGGAMGIAVLGSIVASAYKAGLDVSALPEAARTAALGSVGGAMQVASSIGGPFAGLDLVTAAKASFTDAFTTAMFVASGVALFTSAMVWRVGIGAPGRAEAPRPVEA